MKVILDAEVYYQLRGAAAGARGVLSAMRELHHATAPNVVRNTIQDLEDALSAAAECEFDMEAA